MTATNFMLAYVTDVARSTSLYAKLLGMPPVDQSENFALFIQPNGVKIGLWARHDVAPPPNAPGGMEILFEVDSREAVEQHAREWGALDLALPQKPTDMDFGYTFTALDPDGHRLRVYRRTEPASESGTGAA